MDRFAREPPCLSALPSIEFDTSYRELRRVLSDAYIDVRANQDSVPARFVDETVSIRIGLDNTLRVYDSNEELVASHTLSTGRHEWVLE